MRLRKSPLERHVKKYGPLPPVGDQRFTLEDANDLYPAPERPSMWREFKGQQRKYVPPPVKYTLIWTTIILGGSFAARAFFSGDEGDLTKPKLVIPPAKTIEVSGNPRPNLEYTEVSLKLGEQMLAKVCNGSVRDLNTGQTTIDPLTAPTKQGTLDPIRFDLQKEPLAPGGFIARLSIGPPGASLEWRNASDQVISSAPPNDCRDVPVQLTQDNGGLPHLTTVEGVLNIPVGSSVHKPA